MKWTIIADSSCDLKSADFNSEKFNFVTVPLSMTLNGKDWVDEEDMDVKAFVAAMKLNKDAPKTSCPSPEAFAEKMRSGNENVICMTISGKLSGTNNSANIAAKTVREEQPRKNIYVHDTLSAGAGFAHIIFKLIKLIEEGTSSFEEVTKKLEEIRANTKTRFLLNDTSNLVKTGRMSKVAGILLSILPVKLLCGENGNGEIVKFGQALGMKRGFQSLAELPKEKAAKEGAAMPVTISHCQNEEGAGFIKSLLASRFGLKNVIVLLQRGLASFYANDKGIILAY